MKMKIGIIGVGTVGMGAVQLIRQQSVFFSSKLGIDIEITGICAKTHDELEPVNLPGAFKTIHAEEICAHSEIEIVLELVGGYEPAKSWIITALKNKKHVITANKALLAKYGTELFPLATENNCFLRFEAAVGGGIPIIAALRDSLIANDIEGLACIINGTCNYILTEMTQKKVEFQKALKSAQKKGYAEADPAFDIEGIDSAHKVALMASLCYGKYVDFEDMNIEGITSISKLDVEMASELGFSIKLLGIISSAKQGCVLANVYPALVDSQHQLASVNGVLNAVFIKSSSAGENLLTGLGAGRFPTASAVVSDLIAIGRHLKSGGQEVANPDFIRPGNKLALASINDLETEFYLRLTTTDKPGVLAKISSILAEHHISIDSILQKPAGDKKRVPIIILTHRAGNRDMTAALEKINMLDVVSHPTQVLRFYK